MSKFLVTSLKKIVLKTCHSLQKQQGESQHLSQLVCLLMACVCSLPRDVSPHSELPTTACESYSCSVSVLRAAVSLLTRWKCRGRSSCCHSWRRWAARVSTDCPTPPPQSASPAWLIRNRRVSFYAGGFPPKISSWFVWSLRKEMIRGSWFVIRFLLLQVILSTSSSRTRPRESTASWSLRLQPSVPKPSPSWFG